MDKLGNYERWVYIDVIIVKHQIISSTATDRDEMPISNREIAAQAKESFWTRQAITKGGFTLMLSPVKHQIISSTAADRVEMPISNREIARAAQVLYI